LLIRCFVDQATLVSVASKDHSTSWGMWCDFSRRLWCLRNSHHLISTTWCEKNNMRILSEFQSSGCFEWWNFAVLWVCFPEINLYIHCKTCVYVKKKKATFAKQKIEENTLSHLKPHPFFSPTSLAVKENPTWMTWPILQKILKHQI